MDMTIAEAQAAYDAAKARRATVPCNDYAAWRQADGDCAYARLQLARARGAARRRANAARRDDRRYWQAHGR